MESITPILCYLDPATGSLTFQILVGGILAIAATWRGLASRLRRLALAWRGKKP